MLNRELVRERVLTAASPEMIDRGGLSDRRILLEFVQIARRLVEEQRLDSILGLPLHQPGPVSTFNGRDPNYFIGGIFHAEVISNALDKWMPAQQPLDVLDFGCGAGRLLRFLVQFKPLHRYYGCEVNQAAVDWLSQTFVGVKEIRSIPSLPPTTYSNGTFDAVYAWSIFTHFDEVTHLAWLSEIRRMLRPGGVALLTVHNDRLVERYGTEAALVRRMHERGADYNAVLSRYKSEGFSYWSAVPPEAASVGIDPATFGMAFISPEYIRSTWTAESDLCEIVKDADKDWQDLVVLRRRD